MTYENNSGIRAAKSGLQAEINIIKLFNNWKLKESSKLISQLCCLEKINISNIQRIQAFKPQGCIKADCVVIITLKNGENIERNISIKKVEGKIGFNQLDKRWSKKYAECLNMPQNILDLFKFFTGENEPAFYKNKPILIKDKRRLLISEFSNLDKKIILKWIENNAENIGQLAFNGSNNPEYPIHYMLLVKEGINNIYKLCNIKDVMSLYLGDRKAKISPKGSIYLGKLTIQRKGGDNGKNTSNMLQIKFNPCLMEIL